MFLHLFTFFESWYKTESISIFNISRAQSSGESRDFTLMLEFSCLYLFNEKTWGCLSFEIWIGGNDNLDFSICRFNALKERWDIEVSNKYPIHWRYSSSKHMIDSRKASWLFQGEEVKVFFYNANLLMISTAITTKRTFNFIYVSNTPAYTAFWDSMLNCIEIFFEFSEVFRIRLQEEKSEFCCSVFPNTWKQRNRMYESFKCFRHEGIY